MAKKQDQHGCIQQLKSLADKLGRTPTRTDVRNEIPGLASLIEKSFPVYGEALKAAGLSPTPKKQDQLKQLFRASIDEALERFRESHRKLDPIQLSPGFRILFIGDAHFPFADLAALSAIYDRVEAASREGRPFTHIVQGGDLYDMLAHGRFPRSLNVYTPADEMALGQKMAAEMWETLRKLAPRAKCLQLLGNHDSRPLKRILESYPEAEIFFSIDRFFAFEGVTTLMDAREELVFIQPDGSMIAVHHGFMSKPGQHRDHFLTNTVVFHTHKPWTVFRNMGFGRGVQFEANGGFVGDPESKALGYTPTKLTSWVRCWLEVDELGPRVIPI